MTANTQAIARAQQMDLMGALALFQEAGSSEADAVIERLAGEMQAYPAAIRPFAMEQVQTFLRATVLLSC